MQFSIHPSFTRNRACFTVIVAPESVLLPALGGTLSRAMEKAHYLAGDETALFARLIPVHHKTRLERVGRTQELITALGASDHPLILIEYDRGWFDGDLETALQFVYACREKAHETGATVLLIADRPSARLLQISEGAHRTLIHERLPAPRRGRPRPERTAIPGPQTTLDGVC
jgi:hypothetical protein